MDKGKKYDNAGSNIIPLNRGKKDNEINVPQTSLQRFFSPVLNFFGINPPTHGLDANIHDLSCLRVKNESNQLNNLNDWDDSINKLRLFIEWVFHLAFHKHVIVNRDDLNKLKAIAEDQTEIITILTVSKKNILGKLNRTKADLHEANLKIKYLENSRKDRDE